LLGLKIITYNNTKTMNYSILINTCDKFEDCWNPFFKLWSIYWPNCNAPIYLNTEYKSYSYSGLNIIPVKGCQTHHIPQTKRITWSQCLKWALEKIDTDIILYMQEDYFLKDMVKNEIVEQYVKLMHECPSIQCIHLTDQAAIADKQSTYGNNLKKVNYKQRYRVSCQAALWRKEELLTIIREYENAWEFEEFGSQRSAIIKHEYLAVDNNWVQLDNFEIIPYIFTGIIQGRWYEKVVSLFEKHNININYNIRGFISSAPRKSIKKRIKYRLNKFPKIFRNYIELYRLKKQL
jgi:hypothetical protein